MGVYVSFYVSCLAVKIAGVAGDGDRRRHRFHRNGRGGDESPFAVRGAGSDGVLVRAGHVAIRVRVRVAGLIRRNPGNWTYPCFFPK